ncbi:MAG: hypothetical protein KF729_19515 [Sandaracinaceae bacterium]|nr:hypothetical protein [Sandaracinaceae bacterium]
MAAVPLMASPASAQIGPPRQITGAPVAAQAVRARFVWGGTNNRILYVNQADEVFFHRVQGNAVQMHIRMRGHTVGHPGDPTEYVIPWGPNHILVVTRAGLLYRHQIRGESIGPPEQIPGSPVGTQGQDPIFMFRLQNRLINVTRQGEIWAHVVSNTVQMPTRIGSVGVQAPRQVRHAFNIGRTVYVIFSDNSVVSHDINPALGQARLISAPNYELGQPATRFVFIMGNRLYAVNEAGTLWAYDITRLLPPGATAAPTEGGE